MTKIQGQRATHEDMITTALLRPGLLNGELANVRPQEFLGELPRTVACEAMRYIEAKREVNPTIVGANVVELGHHSAAEVSVYLTGLDDEWGQYSDEHLKGCVREALTVIDDSRNTADLGKNLDRWTAALRAPGASFRDVIPDIREAASQCRYSILAPSISALRELKLVVASELGPTESPPWLKVGYFARGSVTLVIAPPKVGKTTWIAHTLADICAGGLADTRAIVISEESSSLWTQRRDVLGLTDDVAFILRPFKTKPTLDEWHSFIDMLTAAVRDDGYSLVVLDPWATVSPVPDENDAARTMDALLPLHQLTEAGSSVVVVHHARKSEATEGQAARGSGALPGFVDIIVELRRFDVLRVDDPKRILRVYSRFDAPPETVIELGRDGYASIGTRTDAVRAERIEAIENMLTDEGLTPKEILASWPRENGPMKPGLRTLEDDLTHARRQGGVNRTGKGVRGNPFLFSQVPNTSTRESNSTEESAT